jgi:manganese efflux pump family protein
MPQVSFLTVIITAIGLSADCFAVSLSISITQRGLSFRRFLAFPLAFGIFQASMLLIGWAAGRSVERFISSYDHWLAFALLTVIGIRMIWESFREKEKERTPTEMNRWFTVLALALATSIDALAVGLS